MFVLLTCSSVYGCTCICVYVCVYVYMCMCVCMRGGDPIHRDQAGSTPLHLAVMAGMEGSSEAHLKTCLILLHGGADPNATSENVCSVIC